MWEILKVLKVSLFSLELNLWQRPRTDDDVLMRRPPPDGRRNRFTARSVGREVARWCRIVR